MKTQSVAKNGKIGILAIGMLAGMLCTPWFSACGGPDQVSSEPRTSKFQPVFGEDKPAAAQESPNYQFDLSFLYDSCFACIRINPASFLREEDFKGIQWQDLEAQLAKVLGAQNSRLNTMTAIWMILDRSAIPAMESANRDSGPPIIWIFDYASPIDVKQVDDPLAQRPPSEFSVKILSDTRLAIGSKAALSKLVGNTSMDELAHLVSNWDQEKAAQGALTIGPIRSFLLPMFEMLSRLAPEAKAFASLPDVVDNIQLSVNLEPPANGDHILVEGTISIADDKLAKDIVKSLSGLGEHSPAAITSMFKSGMGATATPVAMFQPSSMGALEILVTEIKKKNLFSVQNETGQIGFRLLRPDSLSQAIAAIVADGKRQLELVARVESLQRIAEAMKAYEAKYGHLPSIDAVALDESNNNTPPQFNWRTAILPFLGEQELYDRFDFGKPWNAPENLAVAKDIPDVFKINGDTEMTTLQLVAGVDGVYRADRPQPRLSDITDRPIWTAIVIESDEKLAHDWIQPGIVEIDDASSEDLGRRDENGVLIINADFEVRAVKKDNELIRKVLTSDGGETMSRTDFIPLKLSNQN